MGKGSAIHFRESPPGKGKPNKVSAEIPFDQTGSIPGNKKVA